MVGHECGGDRSFMRRLGDNFANGAWTSVGVYPYLHAVTPFLLCSSSELGLRQ